MTSLGGMAYLAEYLRESGFLDTLLRDFPLRYSSPNAPEPADVMGSLLVAVMDGLSRYAGINELRRDRGDCENIFDKLKHQWGWGGFVTRDLARTRFVTRFVALLYNLWSIFTRLVSPQVHREAKTSRPALLNVIGRITRSGRTTVLHLVSNHALADRICVALDSIHSCTVKAYAVCDDYLDSEVASFSIEKVWGIGDTMGAPDHAFTTGGNLPFFRVVDAPRSARRCSPAQSRTNRNRR